MIELFSLILNYKKEKEKKKERKKKTCSMSCFVRSRRGRQVLDYTQSYQLSPSINCELTL